MGWRRKIAVSTLLSFLISILLFELAEQFETIDELMEQKGGHEHSYSALLKHITMWFWPEFLIGTLEHLVHDKLPVSS